MKTLHTWTGNLSSIGTVRQIEFDHNQTLVAPVVMITEGVHSGSRGPYFYPASAIEETAALWNGVAIPITHPRKGGRDVSVNDPEIIETHTIGRMFNVRYDAERSALVGDAYINIEKANLLDDRIVSRILAGEDLEVSTGLMAGDDGKRGVWKNETHQGTIEGIYPDHMAFLPDNVGACSVQDGCGVRTNEKGGDEMSVWAKVRELVRANDAHSDEFIAKIATELELRNSDQCSHWVRKVFDDRVVFESVGSATGTGDIVSMKLHSLNYTVDADGKVELTGEPVEVKETDYVPVDNKAPDETGDDPEEDAMKKDQIIAALVANDCCPFGDEDKETLGNFSQEKLQAMHDRMNEEPKVEEPKVEPVVEPVVEDEPKTITPEEAFAALDPSLRATLQRAQARDNAERDEIVTDILGNEKNKFTKEALVAMDRETLLNIQAVAVAPEVDYSLRGGLKTQQKNDDDPNAIKPIQYDWTANRGKTRREA